MFTPNATYSSASIRVSTYKPQTMTQGSCLTNAGNIYRRAISKQKYLSPQDARRINFYTESTPSDTSYIAHRCISTDRSSGSVIQRRKAIATGKSKIIIGKNNEASYATNDVNLVRNHLRKTRNMGQIVPPKTRGFLPSTNIWIRPIACGLS